MKILPYGRHHIDEDDVNSIINLLKNDGDIAQGPMISNFEEEFAKYVGSEYAVAVTSCTAGLHLSCLAIDLEKSQTAVTSNISFVSSANCASFIGAKVKFLDIYDQTLNLSIDKLEESLSLGNNFDLLIAVHFAGYPLDMKRLKLLSEKYNFKIIEDAAHALGSAYIDGKNVGSSYYSDATVFSLHPVKSITAGEGGVITTNNKKIYKKLLRLRSHGINKNDDILLNKDNAFTDGKKNVWYYEMQMLGYHYRINDIQCALALSQLKKLPKFIDKREELANYYRSALKSNKYIKPAQNKFSKRNANHIFPVRINFKKLNIKRNDLMLFLRSNGIITQVHYLPISLHPYYQTKEVANLEYTESMRYYDEALTLPLFYEISTAHIDKVLDLIGKFFTNKGLN